MPINIIDKELEKMKDEFDVFPLFSLPAYCVKVVGYDKGGIAFSGQHFDTESFLRTSLSTVREETIKEVMEEVDRIIDEINMEGTLLVQDTLRKIIKQSLQAKLQSKLSKE